MDKPQEILRAVVDGLYNFDPENSDVLDTSKIWSVWIEPMDSSVGLRVTSGSTDDEMLDGYELTVSKPIMERPHWWSFRKIKTDTNAYDEPITAAQFLEEFKKLKQTYLECHVLYFDTHTEEGWPMPGRLVFDAVAL